MSYKNLLFRFTKMSKDIFRNNLTGIYLHGSYFMGCFNPKKSDLDLILVIEDDISDEQKMAFMKNLVKMNDEALAKGIEMSMVKRKFCNPFVYPTPFELHFSVMHLSWFKEKPEDYVDKMKGTDKDLAAHFTIINQNAVVLYGAEVKDVFGKVPKLDYVNSIWNDIKEAKVEIYLRLVIIKTINFYLSISRLPIMLR